MNIPFYGAAATTTGMWGTGHGNPPPAIIQTAILSGLSRLDARRNAKEAENRLEHGYQGSVRIDNSFAGNVIPKILTFSSDRPKEKKPLIKQTKQS